MKPFGQLSNEVARKLSVPVGGDYAATQIRDFLQNRYRRVWDYKLWPQTLEIVSITVPANQNYWVLPKRFETAMALVNANQQDDGRFFDLVAFAQRNLQSDSTSINGVKEVAPLGERGVENQLSSAGIVKISSSASADTSKQVYVRGLVGGEIRGEVITTNASNGTTVVSGTLSFTEVQHVSKLTNPTTGVITVTDNAGTTTLTTISPWEISPQYKWYRLTPTYSDSQTLSVVAKKRFIPFLNKADVAMFDMDACLIAGATSDGWREHRQYQLAELEEAQFERELGELVSKEFNQSGTVEVFAPWGRF